MNEEEIEVHAVFKGHVQGVGFRVTALEHARRLGLAGTVRNLPGGEVEVYALGMRSVIDDFIKSLRDEFAGHIHLVDVEEIRPSRSYEGFHIMK